MVPAISWFLYRSEETLAFLPMVAVMMPLDRTTPLSPCWSVTLCPVLSPLELVAVEKPKTVDRPVCGVASGVGIASGVGFVSGSAEGSGVAGFVSAGDCMADSAGDAADAGDMSAAAGLASSVFAFAISVSACRRKSVVSIARRCWPLSNEAVTLSDAISIKRSLLPAGAVNVPARLPFTTAGKSAGLRRAISFGQWSLCSLSQDKASTGVGVAVGVCTGVAAGSGVGVAVAAGVGVVDGADASFSGWFWPASVCTKTTILCHTC